MSINTRIAALTLAAEGMRVVMADVEEPALATAAAAMMRSFAEAAASGRPRTGAQTKARSADACISERVRANWTPTVLMEM